MGADEDPLVPQQRIRAPKKSGHVPGPHLLGGLLRGHVQGYGRTIQLQAGGIGTLVQAVLQLPEVPSRGIQNLFGKGL